MPKTSKAIISESALAEHADAIRTLARRAVGDLIEIGRRLTEAKTLCGHGGWLPWLTREFGWTEQTALNFMRVHELSKSKNFLDLSIPVSGLYLLAAPSTPPEVVDEVIDRAKSGERVTHAEIAQAIAEVRATFVFAGTGTKDHVAELEKALDRAEADAEAAIDSAKPTARAPPFGNGEYEHYTPANFVEAVRKALGDIDLDPASCAAAQEVVRAKEFFTAETDGLAQPWHGRVFLNPPYHRDLIPRFVAKLVDEIGAGRVAAAIMLTNNCTETDWFDVAFQACAGVCFTHGRIRFANPVDGDEVGSPPRGQVFIYFGADVARFEDVFGLLGSCARPVAQYLDITPEFMRNAKSSRTALLALDEATKKTTTKEFLDAYQVHNAIQGIQRVRDWLDDLLAAAGKAAEPPLAPRWSRRGKRASAAKTRG
jgi:hypothetical protein